MKLKKLFALIVIVGIFLFHVGCSDDSVYLQPEVNAINAEDTSSDTRATVDKSFDTDWESQKANEELEEEQ